MSGYKTPVEINKSIPPMSLVATGLHVKAQWWANGWHFAWFARLPEDRLEPLYIEIIDTEGGVFDTDTDYETLVKHAETVSIRNAEPDTLPDVVEEQLSYNGFEIVDGSGGEEQ